MMKQKNKHAVLLSKKEGISYSEAYDEMMIIKWATGLSFSDYIKNDLHSLDPKLRFRKAERIYTLKKFRARYAEEISDILDIDVSEVRRRIKKVQKEHKKEFFVSTAIYHDYEFYRMNENGINTAVKLFADRKHLSDSFRKLLDSPGSYYTHIEELEKLYDGIRNINRSLLTDTLVSRFSDEFKVIYPQMMTNESAAREISLDFITLRSAAGFDTLTYKLYDMYSKALPEKLSYVSKRDKTLLVDSFNSLSSRYLLDDKYSCYKKFRPYFGREIIEIKSSGDLLRFWLFCRRHAEFVKKPLYSQQGKGIRKINVREYGSIRKMLNALLKEDGEFIAEELLQGHPSTAVFNRDSLNTLRILTFNAGKKIAALDESANAFSKGLVFYAGAGVYCLAPFFKAGRSGSFVDNAGGGGVFSAISLLDGKSSAIASDEQGATYTVHPDSGIRFDSLQFDSIREATGLVAKLALEIPEVRFIGWDLALTDKNEWVLVEANFTPTFIGQAPAQTGIHEIVHQLITETEKPSY